MPGLTTADALARIPMFAALEPDARERIAAVSRLRRFAPDEVVVHEGEFAFDAYAIVSGAAQVVQDGAPVAVLAAGEVFGELGVVPGEGRRFTRRRSASVVVSEVADVLVIDGAALRSLAAEVPSLHAAVEAAVARRAAM